MKFHVSVIINFTMSLKANSHKAPTLKHIKETNNDENSKTKSSSQIIQNRKQNTRTETVTQHTDHTVTP